MSARLRVVNRSRAARDVWGDVVEKAARRMEEITGEFASGILSEADYVLEMRSLVKSLHMGGLAVGKGGIANVTQKDLRRMGPMLRDEYGFIARKVGRIQAGETTAEAEVSSVGGFANRARGTFENATVAASGHRQVRRIVHSGESCKPSDGSPNCEHEAGRGWTDLADFVPIGRCVCGHACRCSVITRDGE